MKKNGARKRGNEKHRASVLTFRSEAKKDEKNFFTFIINCQRSVHNVATLSEPFTNSESIVDGVKR